MYSKDSVDSSDMLPLDGYEEVKKGKELKISTPNELLTWLPILLSQIKAGNNSNKLKNEIRQILFIFCINTIISPRNFATV